MGGSQGERSQVWKEKRGFVGCGGGVWCEHSLLPLLTQPRLMRLWWRCYDCGSMRSSWYQFSGCQGRPSGKLLVGWWVWARSFEQRGEPCPRRIAWGTSSAGIVALQRVQQTDRDIAVLLLCVRKTSEEYSPPLPFLEVTLSRLVVRGVVARAEWFGDEYADAVARRSTYRSWLG